MNKVAIITGASSGIGRQSAIALSAAGWSLALTARSEAALNETAALCMHPERCWVFVADITDEGKVKELFEGTLKHFERLDMLFNNAGVGAPQVPIEDLPLSTFQHVMNVNVVAPFLCTREAVRVFKKQDPPGGRIINNASISAHTPRPHSSPYTCSKHAISGLTKCTALDGRAFGITCTQIDIGNAATKSGSRHSAGALQPDGRTIPEATFDPKWVADSVVHIAGLPRDVTVLEFNIMAAEAPFVGRG